MPEEYASLLLRNQLCFPLYLCSKEITRQYEPMLASLNLTYTQYIVMLYFWEMGSGCARDLSRALLLDPSTLTPILKKLEQKGYLRRDRNADDERSLRITLTDKGAALKDAARNIPARMGACLGLTEDEAVTLRALTGRILSNLKKEL